MTPSTINRVHARRVFDSRGRPTVEAEIRLASGVTGRGIAPAGASRGTNEAIDLRDGGTHHAGYDVALAIANVRGPIARALFGMDATDQTAVDAKMIELDGTPNKSKLGGNAMVAVSLAVAQAGALAFDMPLWQYIAGDDPVSLPMPEVQIFGGGAHAGRRIDIQDLMVMPIGAWSYSDAITMVAEIYRAAGDVMRERGKIVGVADEGGWWPEFSSNEEALEATVRAIERAGCHPGGDAAISLDIAASDFGRDGRYTLALDKRELDRDGMAQMLLDWIEHYPIVSVEDPFGEDDPQGWIDFTRAARHRVQIIGDDLLVTHVGRIEQAAVDQACNAVLIKINQAGTLTEAKAALDAAKAAGFGTIVSARSGETEDTAIAHLAVGWNAGQLKVGAFARSERLAKWNEILRIEDALGGDGRFAGVAALPPRK